MYVIGHSACGLWMKHEEKRDSFRLSKEYGVFDDLYSASDVQQAVIEEQTRI